MGRSNSKNKPTKQKYSIKSNATEILYRWSILKVETKMPVSETEKDEENEKNRIIIFGLDLEYCMVHGSQAYQFANDKIQ